jgi:hypothetical protein
MKPFTVSITRDILDQHFRDEISYTKMVELLNERVLIYLKQNRNYGCLHSEIEYITIHPTDGNMCQQDATYFRCAICGEHLPIVSFTEKTINVPLYPEVD